MFHNHVTYANVVSTFALLIALSGASYAAVALPKGSVGTPQLKQGAVTSAKVKDGSLLAKDLKPGQLEGVPGYERVQTVIDVQPGDSSISASAECPAGTKLLGGGYVIQDSKFHVTASYASSNDLYGLVAHVLPGETITSPSQASVVAICGIVD